MLFSRILVPIDDGDASNVAATLGARLARQYAGELILCHAVHRNPELAHLVSSDSRTSPSPIISALTQRGERILTRVAAEAARFGVVPERRVIQGRPADAILRVARRTRCSLIIMGTNNLSVERLALGSITNAVLRGTPIPVLTVRPGVHLAAEPHPCFERVLVGIDGSDPSDAAIETVLALPPEYCKEIIFHGVVDLGVFASLTQTPGPAVREAVQTRTRQRVDRAVLAAREKDRSAQGDLSYGPAGDALAVAARVRQADLIVVGSHGRRGLRLGRLGAVAEGVVRSSSVPVMVVRTARGAVGIAAVSTFPDPVANLKRS